MPVNNDQNKNFSDLVLVSIWVIITFIFIITIPENVYIRTILAIPIVLFIPGYLLVTALFPMKDDLDIIGRIVLSFGLSIAIIPILGLLLNFTFGIELVPVFITLCIYVIIFTSITAYRRKILSEEVQFSVQFHRIYCIINDWLKPKNSIDSILTIILIFMTVLSVGTVYYTITYPKIGETFTEFYITDPLVETSGYSTSLKLNSSTNWSVYVVNHEYAHIKYTLQVVLDKNILVSRQLTLDHNQKWEKNITMIPNKEGTNQKLEFLLFKDDNFTTPYRSLHLWINTE